MSAGEWAEFSGSAVGVCTCALGVGESGFERCQRFRWDGQLSESKPTSSSIENSDSLSANHSLGSGPLTRLSDAEPDPCTDDAERGAEMVECVDCERSSGRREDEREPEHDECRLWVFSDRAAVMVSTGGRRLRFTPPPLPLALDAWGNCSASLRVNGARALTLTIFLNSKSTSYWTPQ
jgi:hypothetical protein